MAGGFRLDESLRGWRGMRLYTVFGLETHGLFVLIP
jgi:hypothetical protein